MYELEPRYDTRQSFYKKAMVNDVYGDESVLALYSYGTLVAQITKNKNKTKYHYFGKYSQTTTRHQKEFFKQAGLSDKEIKTLFKEGIMEV
jgi:hypothetical protein